MHAQLMALPRPPRIPFVSSVMWTQVRSPRLTTPLFSVGAAIPPRVPPRHRFMSPTPATVTSAPMAVSLDGRRPKTHTSNGSVKSGDADARTFPTATPLNLIPETKSSELKALRKQTAARRLRSAGCDFDFLRGKTPVRAEDTAGPSHS